MLKRMLIPVFGLLFVLSAFAQDANESKIPEPFKAGASNPPMHMIKPHFTQEQIALHNKVCASYGMQNSSDRPDSDLEISEGTLDAFACQSIPGQEISTKAKILIEQARKKNYHGEYLTVIAPYGTAFFGKPFVATAVTAWNIPREFDDMSPWAEEPPEETKSPEKPTPREFDRFKGTEHLRIPADGCSFTTSMITGNSGVSIYSVTCFAFVFGDVFSVV